MALLAERLRPSFKNIDSLVGKAKTVWNRELKQWCDLQKFHIVFWGPPGTGKTTLARILAEAANLQAIQLSAVKDGVKEIRSAVEKNLGGIVFIDEIHRLSKNQQDVLLPILETSEVWVIGATTENPSVTLVPALLSRIRTIYISEPTEDDIKKVLIRGLNLLIEENPAPLEENKANRLLSLINNKISALAKGDVRFALNLLEVVFYSKNAEDEDDLIINCLRSFTSKKHYDWISAMIKSMRGSDPDAALFYAFMSIDSGEDPLFIMRRCIIFASEDVGNTDPQALALAINAFKAIETVGMPEGRIPLAQCVTYLASTWKSNRAYMAIDKVRAWREKVNQISSVEIAPPLELTMKGKDNYKYPHSFPNSFVKFEYLPAEVAKLRAMDGPAYIPTNNGFESKLLARLLELWKEK